MPCVSVIVPNYNHAQFLKQRIDSILNQSFQDFELILLDDCSTDNSRDILSSYASNPHVTHLVFSERNSGSPFAQWNKGIGFAQGEWIWIAESDDWADEHFLEKMLSATMPHPTAGLLYSKAQYVYPDGSTWTPPILSHNVLHKGECFIKQQLVFFNSVYNVSMTLFRKSIYHQVDMSLYNKMRLCGDWFFYVLLCEHTDVLEVNSCLSYYRIHHSNTSESAEKEGKTFIEGLCVLNHIVDKYSVNQFAYSHFWAKQLVQYISKYQIPHSVINEIEILIKRQHPLMYVFYRLYVIKNRISVLRKNIKRNITNPKQGEVWCLHRVTPNRSAFLSNRELEITPDFLEHLITQKKQAGFRFVPLEKIVFGNSYFNRKQIHISFDDGFKDVYEYAFPILVREQIPFTIFLTTGMPEGMAHLWWLQLEELAKNADDFEILMREIYDSGKNMSQYFCEKFGVQSDNSLTRQYSLSWTQIKEMFASGLCTIGSHTHSHSALTRIGEDNIISELETSKRIIENKLSITPTYFSYPHSMENATIQKCVKRAGFSHAFTVSGGGIRTNHNPYCLNRINIVQP